MSSSKQRQVAAAVAQAMKERGAAIPQRAHELAKAFRRDPGSFVPEALVSLGRGGLRQFLSALGAEPDPFASKPPDASGPNTTDARAEGWTHRPRGRRFAFARVVGAAALAGALVIAAASVGISSYNL